MYSKFLILFLFLIISCKKPDPYFIDVSDIELSIEIQRFEKDLFGLPRNDFSENVSTIIQKYPDVSVLLIEKIYRSGSLKDTAMSWLPVLEDFVFNNYIQEVYADVNKKYDPQSIELLEQELEKAFKHVLYYFPEDTIPEFYTIITAFAYSTITYQNTLSVSLDMYLGKDYKFYPSLDYPEFKTRRMDQPYIVPDVMMAYAQAIFDEAGQTDNTLLSQMIYRGKILHYLDRMLPRYHDSIKIQYTKEQSDWSKSNEKHIWKHFIEKDLFFKTDHLLISRYMDDAPFTAAPGMPGDSSPRIGEWLGWQIVRSYMKNNPDVSFAQLMHESDYKKIFNEAGYRP